MGGEDGDMKEMVGGCCVCSDESGWDENPLVYCDGDGCNVAVHQACYGIVSVPPGPWFCRKCESQERAARVRCELCPDRGGALKRTDTAGWAHVVCALYIPEVRFGDVATMEPILVSIVPPERFSKTCCLCELNGRASKAAAGACMSCNKPGCRLSFHVTCAQGRGLLCEEPLHSMNNVTYCGYCPHHYAKLKRGHNLKAIPAFKPSQEPAGGGAGDAPALKPALPPPPPADASRAERKTKKPKLSRSPRAQATAELAPPSTHNDSSSSSCLSLASDVTPAGAAEERRDRPPTAAAEPAAVDGSGDREPDPTTPTAGNGSAGDTKFTTANFTETVVTVTGSVFGAAARTGGSEPTTATSGPGTESESTLSAASDLDNKEAALVIKQEVCEPELPPPVPPPPVKPPSPPRSLPPPQPQPQPQPAVASVITSLPAAASSLPLSISPVVSLSQVSPHLVASKTKRPLATTPSDKEHRKRKPPGRPRKHPAPPLPSVSAAVPLPISAPSPVALVPSPVPSGTSALPPTSASASASSTPTPTSSASSSSSASGAALSVVVVEREPAELSPQAVPRKRSSGELPSPLCGGAGASALNGRSGASALAAAARTNGLPAAAHMLGNQLNPGSRLADSLAAEMAEQAAFTPPAPRLCGPQLPVRHTPAPAAHRQTGGSAAAPFPQSLSELLERQWEQGSHFLMEQSQHFDVAALLSCLYQLRQENHQLEEHMSELASRRDHLMVVNARLSLPLENAAPVPSGTAAAAAARSQASQRHSSGASLTSSAGLHGPVLENGTAEPPLQPTPPSPLPHAAVIHSPVGRPSSGASPLGARGVPAGARLPPSVSPQMGAVSRHSPTVRQGSSVPYMMSGGVGGGAPLLMSAGTVAHQQHPQLHQQHPQLQQGSPAGRPMQPPGAAGRPPIAHERDRDQRIMESLRVSAAAASVAAGGYPHYQLVSPPGSGAHQPPPMHHMVHMPPPASHGPPPPGHGPPGRTRPSDKR